MNRNAILFKEFCKDEGIDYMVVQQDEDDDVLLELVFSINDELTEVFVFFSESQVITTVRLSKNYEPKDEVKENEVFRRVNYINDKYSVPKFIYNEEDKTLIMNINNLWDDNFKPKLLMEVVVLALRNFESGYNELVNSFQ